MIKEIEYPFTSAKIRGLKVGETVKLSGRIFTGRDRLHKYLSENGNCPVDLKDGAIYHCGPVMLQKDSTWIVRAAGPTTSMRMEPYMAEIIGRNHVRVIIGKGGMGEETRKACKKHGCVYLQAVGGAAVLLSTRIEQVVSVNFLKEFGTTEAMWELAVKDFEAVVTMDSHGRSLHKRIKAASGKRLKQIVG